MFDRVLWQQLPSLLGIAGAIVINILTLAEAGSHGWTDQFYGYMLISLS